MCSPEDPFHALLAVHKTPFLAFFNSQDPNFNTLSQISINFKPKSLKIIVEAAV